MKVKIHNIKDRKDVRGWLCGQFFSEESGLQTSEMEVRYFSFDAGAKDPEHYHPHGMELVLILSGKVRWRINGNEHELGSGDYYLAYANTPEAVIEVLEGPVTGVAVRTPSVPDNKIYM